MTYFLSDKYRKSYKCLLTLLVLVFVFEPQLVTNGVDTLLILWMVP